MTEQEWLECAAPQPELEFLRRKGGERKVRLFACACCRRVWDHLEEEGSRYAVEIAERYVDGLATSSQLQLARDISVQSKDPVSWGGERACAWSTTDKSGWSAAEGASRASQVVASPAWAAACRRADKTHDP